MKDLFELDTFEESNTFEKGSTFEESDSILDISINESSEVNVPGGDKESPTGVPADVNVKIPSGTTITSDEYNQALSALKKSFQEGAELMGILEKATVVEKDIDALQIDFLENAIDDAILKSYEDGPMFESVDRADKTDIKQIVRKIRETLPSALKDKKISFYKPQLVTRAIIGGLGGAATLAATAGASVAGAVHGGLVTGVVAGTLAGKATKKITGAYSAAAIKQLFSTRLWQVLGVINIEEGNIKDIAESITKEYSDDIGEYKILYVKVHPTLIDMFRTKFNWKNSKSSYFLLVDKKLPKELKEFQDGIAEEVKNGAKSDADDAEDKKDKKKDDKDSK